MTQESMDDLVKKVFEEICKNHKDLDIDRPFNIVVYDPLGSRTDGLMGTRNSLKSTVRALLLLLEKEPTSVGEILIYKPKTKVVYTRLPSQ